MEKYRVLFISYDGLTDQLGQSQVIPYLQGLSEKGFQMTVLSLEKPDRLMQSKNYIQTLLQPYSIEWIWVKYTAKPKVLSTMFDLYKLNRMAHKLMRIHRFDMIHCRSYIPALVGLELKKKFGCKMLFDMRGFWADERIDGGLWNLNNPLFRTIYNFFKSKEKRILAKADHTVSLTENAAQLIVSGNLAGKFNGRISVIPCCVDNSLFDPHIITEERKNELRFHSGIKEGEFVLSYLGAIGTWYMLDEMLKFFKLLLGEIPYSRFLFITQEPSTLIFEKCNELNIDKNHVTVVQANRKEVPAWLSLSNASIFFIKPSFSKQASSPTKQGEIMSMGIPVICNAGVGDTDKIVKDSQSGFVVESFTNDSFLRAVNYLKSFDPYARRSIRDEAIKIFSLEKGVEKYASIYLEVLESNS